MKHFEDYLMLIVLVGPFICAGVGYALDGTWQGILLGAGSGLLLSGVLRRVLRKLTDPPVDENAPDSSGQPASNPPDSHSTN
ncbi:MAG TPA: hypothetical protein P5526_20620 [Anaerolineae bacterium]|nr:hypothetical protein [Anaerolineae bacterium]HRV94575.1 hypothetical protein [Anaerolineae bacterium]